MALTISVFGFHLSNGPSFQVPDQPPSKYEVSPHLGPANRWISCLKSDQHRKRKWSTVSTPFSHAHSVEDAAPIVPRYRLSLHIPVRSWHRIAAWCFGFPLYKDRVCLKGAGALSKLFVNLPVLGVAGRAQWERGKRAKAVERATVWSSGGCSFGWIEFPLSMLFWASWWAFSLPMTLEWPGHHASWILNGLGKEFSMR